MNLHYRIFQELYCKALVFESFYSKFDFLNSEFYKSVMLLLQVISKIF
ncbi:hypothetical protein LEP1GSC074_2204 [Leptospira noguchii str. Hook]|uniref:Uncharacterized protein n=1 Tax=Leptospira noguchii serovar Autumnalis str. ZUN142 TaxID=1085540 RepID=M6U877_9LEPT|nr:hypothetical protein LEP1GSC170_2096 [Leptospira interrogans serovar Bataviae str. HAI135]EMO41232.1 hypothetical protein LEP1GSC186_3063 [Leptospira noguchii serovar Autumnalis str. ZUN142]EMS88410.1 hypothetical protein LEP1GSC074_2204 [Leptospira noguchii str. Hook]